MKTQRQRRITTERMTARTELYFRIFPSDQSPADRGARDDWHNLYGAFAGYRMPLGSFVIRGEVDYVIGSESVSDSTGRPVDLDCNSLLCAGVESGYSLGRALLKAGQVYHGHSGQRGIVIANNL